MEADRPSCWGSGIDAALTTALARPLTGFATRAGAALPEPEVLEEPLGAEAPEEDEERDEAGMAGWV